MRGSRAASTPEEPPLPLIVYAGGRIGRGAAEFVARLIWTYTVAISRSREINS